MERVTDLAEILLANEGSRIRFLDYYNNKQPVEGTYEIISPHRNFAYPQKGSESLPKEFSEERILVAVNTEKGKMMFSVGTMNNIEFLSQPKMEKPKSTKENRLMMKVDGAKGNEKTTLGIAALERGIRWIPAYRVEVKGQPIKEAKLELEAMLVNELTDLKNTEVNFVVGVPHFLFQEQMSPLSMNAAFAGVSSFFQPDATNQRRDSYSNAIMSQIATNSTTGDTAEYSSTVTEGEQTDSFSAEQLFLYKTDQINLKKGERSSLRLFSVTVPAAEVFEWTLSDTPNTQYRYMSSRSYSNPQTLLTDLSSKIWYSLRLINQTGMPWTTAPALSFREWKPLGQDMMTFTPIGGENILRVTPATEVIGNQTLEEKSREAARLNRGGTTVDLDLVTVEGSIKIRNVKKEPIELVLTRNVVGEVSTASDDGKISKGGLNLQSFNPNSIIKWNLKLPPGEKEIKYTYKIYVNR